MPIAAIAPPPEVVRDAAPNEHATQAAAQFEELLLRQLWSVMRKTVGGFSGGSGPGSGMYAHLMDEAMASHLSRAGGLGMQAQLEEAFGGRPAHAARIPHAIDARPVVREPLVLGPTTGMRVSGATARLQDTATEMITGVAAPRWGRDGRLTAAELASTFHTETPDGTAHFNVRDAAGFQGRYKCNLFAFEMVRRSGFQTPLMPRTHGWGYPHPDSVTVDATDGRLRQDWGRVATGESAESLDDAIVTGDRAFLLTGSGRDGHAGHMAVVERVHQVDYDEAGQIERVIFDGWEARVGGAQRLTRRTWNRYGNPGGELARNGFSQIEVVELLAPRDGQPEIPLSRRVGASLHDGEITQESAASSPPTQENADPASRTSGGRPTETLEARP
ncbi:MAG: rod-binding protein [Myxococcota bacterium]